MMVIPVDVGKHLLFRGNTSLTRTLELAMKSFWGRSYLELSIGPTVRRMCEERVSLEVERRGDGDKEKDLADNVTELVKWAQEMWDGIYNCRAECPG